MVRIMTDNAANLPKHLLEQYGIHDINEIIGGAHHGK